MTEFRFELAQLAADCFGQLIGADCPIARIHTDTRSVMPGDLFVAIRGERFDGNAFAAQALAAGAAAVLVERPDAVPPGASAIVVYDSREALAAIARAHRERCAPRVLAWPENSCSQLADLAGVRLYTVTWCPANARWPAMG